MECSLCIRWCHRKCAKLSKKELQQLELQNEYWHCLFCRETFPFYSLDDDEFFVNNYPLNDSENILTTYRKCREFEFVNYNDYEIKNNFPIENIDPDANFYGRINTCCKYYTEENFLNKTVVDSGIKLVHFNCRSIKSSFDAVKQLVSSKNVTFDIIAVSESWLQEKDDFSEYQLENYNFARVDRKTNKVVEC